MSKLDIIKQVCCVEKDSEMMYFVLWNQSLEESDKFFDFMKGIDTSGEIKFTMSVAKDSVLEFLDLNLHINKHTKICIDVYAKPTNSLNVCASFYMLS